MYSVCVCVCVRACVLAACVRARVCVCVCIFHIVMLEPLLMSTLSVNVWRVKLLVTFPMSMYIMRVIMCKRSVEVAGWK